MLLEVLIIIGKKEVIQCSFKVKRISEFYLIYTLVNSTIPKRVNYSYINSMDTPQNIMLKKVNNSELIAM